MRVAVIDYKLCNLDSVSRALEQCGATVIRTDGPEDLAQADKLLLPGVGAFAAAMERLDAHGLTDAIRGEVAAGKPLLGICLGMQLLFETSEEGGAVAGLGIIPGAVKRLVPAAGERVPHMGWNTVAPTTDDPLFAELPGGADFYFVHSYHVVCADPAHGVATTPYGGGFTSVVRRGNVAGAQFHPEKSQVAGFAFLRGFLQSEARAAA